MTIVDLIKMEFDCFKIAQELGATVANGRCAATWRGGDNPTSVSIQKDKFYDHRMEQGGDAITLYAIGKCGGDNAEAIRQLKKRIIKEIPNGRTRYDRLLADGYKVAKVSTFTDENGKVIHEEVRMEHPTLKKEFLQRDANGKWSLDGVETFLYNLPEIKKAPAVAVVEGPKDADTLISHGIPATTNAGGAKHWKKSYSESLRGKYVYVFLDNDEAGQDRGKILVRELNGIAKSVKLITPSKLPKGDITDWFEKEGGTREELVKMVKLATVVAAPTSMQSGIDYARQCKNDGCDKSETTKRLAGRMGDFGITMDEVFEIVMEVFKPSDSAFKLVHALDLIADKNPPEYLVKGYIPLVGTSWVYGPPGCGKSFIALDLSARIAGGYSFIDRKTRQGAVVYLAGEGVHGIKLRLAAWVYSHPGSENDMPVYISDKGGQLDDPSGFQDVCNAIDAIGRKPVLIVIDTQSRWQSGDENSTKDGAAYVRKVDELRDLYGCHVMNVHHCSKAEKAALRGSTTYLGAADCTYKIEKADAIADRHVIKMTCDKIKDSECPPPVAWELIQLRLDGWVDEDGETAVSAYLKAYDAANIPTPKSGPVKRTMVPNEELFRLVREFPEAGRNELCRLMMSELDVKSKTSAGRIIDKLVSIGALILQEESGRNRYAVAKDLRS